MAAARSWAFMSVSARRLKASLHPPPAFSGVSTIHFAVNWMRQQGKKFRPTQRILWGTFHRIQVSNGRNDKQEAPTISSKGGSPPSGQNCMPV